MSETTTHVSGLTGLGCVERCNGETVGASDHVGLGLVGIWCDEMRVDTAVTTAGDNSRDSD